MSMLLMALGLPEDMNHPYILAMKVQVFPKGSCDHDLKAFR